jgi:hypothetical protein
MDVVGDGTLAEFAEGKADWDVENVTVTNKALWEKYLRTCKEQGDRHPGSRVEFGRIVSKLCPGRTSKQIRLRESEDPMDRQSPSKDGARAEAYVYPSRAECQAALDKIFNR